MEQLKICSTKIVNIRHKNIEETMKGSKNNGRTINLIEALSSLVFVGVEGL
jgi:hypothetical protein